MNQPVAIIIHVHMVSLRGGDKGTHPPRLRLRGPGRLTISAARTDLALLIRRAVRPGPPLIRDVDPAGRLSYLATAEMTRTSAFATQV